MTVSRKEFLHLKHRLDYVEREQKLDISKVSRIFYNYKIFKHHYLISYFNLQDDEKIPKAWRDLKNIKPKTRQGLKIN